MFGMMFSDWGHGLMLLGVCWYLRLGWVFYMMGFMSVYCGVVYNEFFGMKVIRCEEMGILHAEWGVAENGLNFENSLKMKISMVVALVHMVFGLILKIVN
jgi:V-type H+-transporting ATPase subunit a